MKTLAALHLTLALLLAGTAAADATAPEDVQGPLAWGGVSNVTHLGKLWFAGQPDRAGLEAARAAGVEVVINLRAPSELDWDEKSAVEELGMSYHNVPVTGPRFDPVAFARIDELVEEHTGREILFHCSSSNRAGGWLATHLVKKSGMSVNEALAVGRRAGITKEGIVARVRALVAERSPTK
jgi:protein tyrosine phosphatase (PTP) superfamily phosphohydrolase (DUF442 family)